MWRLARQVEFANYSSTLLIPPMGGKMVEPFKHLKRPSDLYKLGDEDKVVRKNIEVVYDPDAAIAAYNKTEKDKSKWLTRKSKDSSLSLKQTIKE